jgi:hypothetical protein
MTRATGHHGPRAGALGPLGPQGTLWGLRARSGASGHALGPQGTLWGLWCPPLARGLFSLSLPYDALQHLRAYARGRMRARAGAGARHHIPHQTIKKAKANFQKF